MIIIRLILAFVASIAIYLIGALLGIDPSLAEIILVVIAYAVCDAILNGPRG